MPAFAWRRRETRHFGQQWVPYAELHLESAAGRRRSFAVQVDTGAVISVLRRSAADLLGLKLESGQQIEMAGVGGVPQPYYLHTLSARVGELPAAPTRFAISTSEQVPNLLGRLDVIDRLQIAFDPSLQETHIEPPWLDNGNRRVWLACIKLKREINRKAPEHPMPGRVDEAVSRFMNRANQLLDGGASLLRAHASYELPLILRSLFELSIQFEFLMEDPVPRAELYLEYEHVTKYKGQQAVLNLPGPLGDYLRASPHRAAGEAKNRAEYERVRSRYALAGKPDKVRGHWYQGNLRQLAQKTQREREYDVIYGLYSAWAHGDPWAASLRDVGHAGLVHLLGYWARLLIHIADAKKIILAGEAYQLLAELAKGPSRE